MAANRRPAGARLSAAILVLAAVTAMAACKPREPAAKYQSIPEKDKMRIELEDFSFVPPSGFEDWSNYTFRNESDTRLVTVSAGKRPAEVADLPGLMADRKENLESMLPGVAKYEAEYDGRLGPWPARILELSYEDNVRRLRVREFWAVAFDTPETYVQLSYADRGTGKQAREPFAHILVSVDSHAARGRPAAAGFEHRWAGRFALDVPADLLPPPTYVFVSPDEQVELTLDHYGLRAPRRRPQMLAREAEAEEQRGGIITRKTEGAFSNREFNGTSLIYTLQTETPDGFMSQAYRRMSLHAGQIEVQVAGRAPAERGNELETTMNSWVDTFSRGK